MTKKPIDKSRMRSRGQDLQRTRRLRSLKHQMKMRMNTRQARIRLTNLPVMSLSDLGPHQLDGQSTKTTSLQELSMPSRLGMGLFAIFRIT